MTRRKSPSGEYGKVGIFFCTASGIQRLVTCKSIPNYSDGFRRINPSETDFGTIITAGIVVQYKIFTVRDSLYTVGKPCAGCAKVNRKCDNALGGGLCIP
ncbi:hypothetical protein Y032_0256g367 [Ancylostoma ceylanicum]|uniref:Uncharacterized protein n=1 Tax=Ancylostoma ceylanicum TaxID=53326 RepID=A0A016SBS6_9BILA|nr:hypothetical protein Y032_0256g367 [Ancylostoma ceylanicum]